MSDIVEQLREHLVRGGEAVRPFAPALSGAIDEIERLRADLAQARRIAVKMADVAGTGWAPPIVDEWREP